MQTETAKMWTEIEALRAKLDSDKTNRYEKVRARNALDDATRRFQSATTPSLASLERDAQSDELTRIMSG